MKEFVSRYIRSAVFFFSLISALLQGEANVLQEVLQSEVLETKDFFKIEENFEEAEIDFNKPTIEFNYEEGKKESLVQTHYHNVYVVKEGTKVHGVEGVVTQINNSCKDGTLDGYHGGCKSSKEGFGNFVKIVTDDGYEVTYGHLKEVILNDEGVIGTVGKTGNTSSPQLAVSVRDKDGKPVNPSVVFNK